MSLHLSKCHIIGNHVMAHIWINIYMLNNISVNGTLSSLGILFLAECMVSHQTEDLMLPIRSFINLYHH